MAKLNRPLYLNRAPRAADDPRTAWADRIRGDYSPAVMVQASADDGPASLYLYDPIDDWFGVTASDVRSALDEIGDRDVELHINSPGGDAFDGIAILNLLRQHSGTVTSIVDGLAASAASFIAAGTDQLLMAENSELMIHDAWGICIGPASDMAHMANTLDRMSDNIASIYATKAGDGLDHWRDLMVAETWYVGEEAVDVGLADAMHQSSDPAPAARAVHNLIRDQRPNPRVEVFTPAAIPTTIAAAYSGT